MLQHGIFRAEDCRASPNDDLIRQNEHLLLERRNNVTWDSNLTLESPGRNAPRVIIYMKSGCMIKPPLYLSTLLFSLYLSRPLDPGIHTSMASDCLPDAVINKWLAILPISLYG